ncbi:MAG: hypothetical protein C4557_10225 [Anaerolineaceae bacterium]|jgi:uncharacterized protein YhhL (DUF1145 family)|nr:MAG: hypothetical protein C4557_10225 [Anaerolineaceae bacterium]
MQHPLEFVPINLRKPFFFVFLILTIFIYGIFDILDKPFRNPVSPRGIVSLELAFVPNRAHEIISSWEDARWANISIDDLSAYPFSSFGFVDGDNFLPFHYLFFGLGFDYLFMPVYALALSLGLLLAGHEKPQWLRSYGALAGWGVFIAALFDAVENYTLWKILTGNIITPFPEIAGVCATVKFTLLILGITVAVVSTFSRKEPAAPTSPE